MSITMSNSSKTMTVEKYRIVREFLKTHKPKDTTVNAHCNYCEVWTPADMSVYFFGLCENCAELGYDLYIKKLESEQRSEEHGNT